MTDPDPWEEPVEAAEPEPAPEPEPVAEEPETPTEAPQAPRWLVLTRLSYTDTAGNEFYCGPGEQIDDEFAGQVNPESITPV